MLYYIERFYNYALALGILINFIGIILNLNNYFSYFLLIFYLLLILLKKQNCIDKYSSKVGIAKSVSLIISAILFFILMKPSELQEKYIEFLESNKFDKIMKKQFEYIFNSTSYKNLIEKEIEKQKNKVIEEFNNEIKKIEEMPLSKKEKEKLIQELEEQLNESLKQLDQEKNKIDEGLFDTINSSLSMVKESLKELIDNKWILKAITVSLIVPLLGLINTIIFYISLLINLIIDSLLSFFKKDD